MIRILTGLLFRWWSPAEVEVPPEPEPAPIPGGGGGGGGKRRTARGGGWKAVPDRDILKQRIGVSVNVVAPLPETVAAAGFRHRFNAEVKSEQQIAIVEARARQRLVAAVTAVYAPAETTLQSSIRLSVRACTSSFGADMSARCEVEDTRARIIRQDDALLLML